MIKPLVNIEGKQFKVLASDNINKINPHSRGFVVNIREISRYDAYRPCQTVHAIIYRMGKTGKYRLKHSIIKFPGLISSNKQLNDIISLNTNIKLLSDVCDDVREYSDEKFIGWALSKYLRTKYLLNTTMARNFENVRMIKKYMNDTMIWNHAYKNPFLNDLHEVFIIMNGGIIAKSSHIFNIIKEANIKEDVITAIRTLSSLTTTLSTYHKHYLLNRGLRVARYYFESYLNELAKRKCPAEEMKGDMTKIKPHKKYENYDILTREMYKLIASYHEKKQICARRCSIRMNF